MKWATTKLNNTSSSSTEDLPSKAEGIAWCSAFTLEAVLIVVGNLLTIVLFVVNKKLRKKSLFLVINMAFADLMLGALSLPLYIYFVGADYLLWTGKFSISFNIFSGTVHTFFLKASLISAALISSERFYATYWPLKHRTLSIRAYRIVICSMWTLAIFVSTVISLLRHFLSNKPALYALMSCFLILLFIVCGCNIGIWRKFQRKSIASHHQNRASQNQRLTKTLLFVSTVTLMSWLPLIVLNYLRFQTKLRWFSIFYIAAVLCYCNSFVNPIVYTLRIPAFRQALGSCCFRRLKAMDKEVNGRDNRAVALTPETRLRTLPTDPSHLQLACEQKVMDTKL